jgi:hypothetical protein
VFWIWILSAPKLLALSRIRIRNEFEVKLPILKN